MAPLRAARNHRSEMTSQLLFGESVMVTDSVHPWCKVRSLADGHEGWTDERALSPFGDMPERPVPLRTGETVFYLSRRTVPAEILPLPAGSFLPADVLTEKSFRWGDHAFRLEGDPMPAKSDWFEAACAFLGCPYMWGGKTLLGMDCSGLVQIVARMCGVELPRDARQQAEAGEPVSFAECRRNDLAFFCGDPPRITHVGIVGDDRRILHASGRVRLDTLSEEGILRHEDGRCSHTLFSLKRIRP